MVNRLHQVFRSTAIIDKHFYLERDVRARFRVQMINNIGLEEVGIDGGGVFREFLSELIKTAFDPNRGFFMFVESSIFVLCA